MKLMDLTLDGKNLSQFFEMYPGTFAYFPGTCGVDATFDVCCTKTDKHVVSTHYWEEREEAEMVAAAITVALNRLSHDYANSKRKAMQSNLSTPTNQGG